MTLSAAGTQLPDLSADELDEMARTLSGAFINHATWRSVVGDPCRRVRALYRFFRFATAVIARYGYVVRIDADAQIVGAITLMPAADRLQISFGRIVSCGVPGQALRFLASLRPAELLSMQRFSRAVDEHYLQSPPGDGSLHLYFTGIESAHRGRGIVKAAFAATERFLAEQGYTSYHLETTDETNLPVYERFGMELVSSAAIPGGRTIWFFEKRL